MQQSAIGHLSILTHFFFCFEPTSNIAIWNIKIARGEKKELYFTLFIKVPLHLSAKHYCKQCLYILFSKKPLPVN